MLINVDLDGVVYPFDEAVTRLAEHWISHVRYPGRDWYRQSLTRLPRPSDWEFWHSWGITTEEYAENFWPWAVEHQVFNQTIAPFAGARAGIIELRQAGHHIRFVSHKPTQGGEFKHHAIRDAVQWLSWNHIPYDSVVFDGNKQQYHAEVVIDDKPDCSWVQDDALNILYDQPWNTEEKLTGDWWRTERSEDWTNIVYKIQQRELELAGPV